MDFFKLNPANAHVYACLEFNSTV